MFRLLRVFRPFRYNHTILLSVPLFFAFRYADVCFRTIEVMYLSVRRSQHALLAIGFFVIMILTVFSTLLYVFSCFLYLQSPMSFLLALANAHSLAVPYLTNGTACRVGQSSLFLLARSWYLRLRKLIGFITGVL